MSSSIQLLAFYSLGLLQNTGLSSKISGLGSVGISIAGSVGTIIGILIVKRISLRDVYLISLAGCFLMMVGFFTVGFLPNTHCLRIEKNRQLGIRANP